MYIAPFYVTMSLDVAFFINVADMKETLLFYAINLFIPGQLSNRCYHDVFFHHLLMGYFYQTRNEQNTSSAAKALNVLINNSTFVYECTLTTK